MNCANHPEIAAAAYCRECGKPMCPECQRPALGSVFCEDHAPAAAPPPVPDLPRPSASYIASPYSAPFAPPPYSAPPSPYTAPAAPVADPHVHPALALLLGFIPGVGAIYNGQYAKGLIHAVIFGLLVSVESNSSNIGVLAFTGIMIGIDVIYMAFEAYHTARKRRYGMEVEEFSSLLDVRPAQGRFPVGAIVLILLGFVMLLDTTEIIRMDQLVRYWPALLIVAGIYMLYTRLHHSGDPDVNGETRR